MKQLKKCLSLVVCLALLLTLLPQVAMPIHAVTISGNCGAEGDGSNLIWTLDTDSKTLSITGSGNMKDFTSGNSPWYNNRAFVQTVLLSNGATGIGNYAFYNCTQLSSITIPDGLTRIGDGSFRGCSALNSIDFPDSLSSLGVSAFFECYNLRTVAIPEGVTMIEGSVFHGCSALTSISIPGTVTSIGDYAFDGCSALTSISIPETVTSIGNFTFYKCSCLTEIVFPEGVTNIGSFACPDVTSVTLPSSLSTVQSYAFSYSGDPRPLSINFSDLDAWCRIFRDYRYVDREVHLFLNGEEIKDHLIVPESLQDTGTYSFAFCREIRSAFIPEGITTIGEASFLQCTQLQHIALPASLEHIDVGAFFNCENLKHVLYASDREAWNEIQVHQESLEDSNEDLIHAPYYHYNTSDWESHVSEQSNEPATCTGYGSITFSCPCGYEWVDSIPPLGHDYAAIETGAPTCTERAYTIFTCTRCGDTYISFDYSTSPLGHDYIAVETTANCTEGGYIKYACSRCGDSYTIDTGPLGHDYVACETIMPTCTESGYTIYSCSRCGDSYQYFDAGALGHDYVAGETTATCTKAGYTTYACSRCGDSYTVEDGVLGHNFVDGKCTRCGHWDPSLNEFNDIAEGKYYFDAVLWAVHHDPQITGGTGNGQFSPNKTCTREQIVTFLWKAKGAPEPTMTFNPFTDVKESKYYYKAVLWAVQNGITGGVGDGKFGVGQPCTREQAVTFLWKACGSPEPTTTENPFTDVKEGKYYYKAVLWAVENGITGGTSADKFGVGKTCTRAQIVTFLYKALGE